MSIVKDKVSRWGTRQYRLQVYLPEEIKTALDRYTAEQFTPTSRVVSAVIRKAVAEFLQRAGYMEGQGGDQ